MPVIEKYRHKRGTTSKIGVLHVFRVAYSPHCVYDDFGVQQYILERMTHGCQRRKMLNLLFLYLHLRVAYRLQDIYDNFVCANRGSKEKKQNKEKKLLYIVNVKIFLYIV